MHLRPSQHSLVKATALCAVLGLILVPSATLAANGSASYEAESEFETELENGYVGRAFVLDGTRSADDGVVKTYTWTQVSGPFKFTTQAGSQVSVTPPTAGTYVFELTATDSAGQSQVVKRVEVAVVGQAAGVFQPNQTDIDFIAESGSSNSQDQSDDDILKPDDNSEAGPALLEIDDIKGESPEKGDTRTSANIAVSAVEVRGWDPEKKKEILGTAKVAAEVRSNDDLEQFAQAAVASDVNLKGVKIKENVLDVDYIMPAKFLGLFNASLTAHTQVDANSRVKVRFPWLSFLYTKPTPAAMEQQLEQAIAAQAGGQEGQKDPEKDWVNLDSMSLQEQMQKTAQMLQILSNTLNTMHNSAKSIIQNIRA